MELPSPADGRSGIQELFGNDMRNVRLLLEYSQTKANIIIANLQSAVKILTFVTLVFTPPRHLTLCWIRDQAPSIPYHFVRNAKIFLHNQVLCRKYQPTLFFTANIFLAGRWMLVQTVGPSTISEPSNFLFLAFLGSCYATISVRAKNSGGMYMVLTGRKPKWIFCQHAKETRVALCFPSVMQM